MLDEHGGSTHDSASTRRRGATAASEGGGDAVAAELRDQVSVATQELKVEASALVGAASLVLMVVL